MTRNTRIIGVYIDEILSPANELPGYDTEIGEDMRCPLNIYIYIR